MNIKTAFSVKTDPQNAVADIQAQLKGFDPKLIVFFASSTFAPDEIAERMEAAFPSAETFGCSTAGEIVTGKMLTKSVVAMAFNKQAIKDCQGGGDRRPQQGELTGPSTPFSAISTSP